MQRKSGRDSLTILVIWCLGIVFVDPSGDFPLNDDWSYGLTVRQLLQSGAFHPVGWTSMPLLSHACWGSVACLPFGFSFEALRASTLILSLVGTLGSYFLLLETGKPRPQALIGSLAIAFSPIYFSLSYTFMTDVPFTTWTTLAALFFLRFLRRSSTPDLLLATGLSLVATMNRQLGVGLPAAFFIVLLTKRGLDRRTLVVAAIPFVIGVGALLGLRAWLSMVNQIPALYDSSLIDFRSAISTPETYTNLVTNGLTAMNYCGWFLAPGLLLAIGPVWSSFKNRPTSKRGIAIVALGVLVIVAFPAYRGELMPLSKNVLAPAGIGPHTLYDSYVLDQPFPTPLPRALWAFITALGSVSSIVLFLYASRVVRQSTSWTSLQASIRQDNGARTFLLVAIIVYSVPILLVGFFDRYLIPLLPILAGFLPPMNPVTGSRGRLVFACALLLLSFSVAFSIGGTRDYLSWNRARWQALDDLINQGVDASDVDGGFEFNGLHFYDPAYEIVSSRSWWWVANNRYVIAFSPIPGYVLRNEYPYKNWLPPENRRILALERPFLRRSSGERLKRLTTEQN